MLMWAKINTPHLYNYVIMSAMASQITSLTSVCPNVYWGADQRKHQSSAWLAFLRGIRRWPVNSTQKWSVTRKMVPFDDVIMHCKTHVKWSPSSTILSNISLTPMPVLTRQELIDLLGVNEMLLNVLKECNQCPLELHCAFCICRNLKHARSGSRPYNHQRCHTSLNQCGPQRKWQSFASYTIQALARCRKSAEPSP